MSTHVGVEGNQGPGEVAAAEFKPRWTGGGEGLEMEVEVEDVCLDCLMLRQRKKNLKATSNLR